MIRGLYKRSEEPRSRFGDAMVIAFFVTQGLDGIFTYLGVSTWGPGIEANPIVSSAMLMGGTAVGLGGTKLVAIGFGMLLHLVRVHNVVALLTVIYFTAAIVPWATLFLTH